MNMGWTSRLSVPQSWSCDLYAQVMLGIFPGVERWIPAGILDRMSGSTAYRPARPVASGVVLADSGFR